MTEKSWVTRILGGSFFAQDGNPGQPKILGEDSLLFLLSLCRLLSHCFLCLCLPFLHRLYTSASRQKSKQECCFSVVVQTRECKKFRRQTRTSKKSDQTSTKSKYPRAERPRIFRFCRNWVRLFRPKANVKHSRYKCILTVCSENTCRKRKLKIFESNCEIATVIAYLFAMKMNMTAI